MGRDLGTMDMLELSRHRNRTIGMIFQSFNLLPRMTVFENVELPLRLAEIPRAERPARVEEALKRVGLAALRRAIGRRHPYRRERHRPSCLGI